MRTKHYSVAIVLTGVLGGALASVVAVHTEPAKADYWALDLDPGISPSCIPGGDDCLVLEVAPLQCADNTVYASESYLVWLTTQASAAQRRAACEQAKYWACNNC